MDRSDAGRRRNVQTVAAFAGANLKSRVAVAPIITRIRRMATDFTVNFDVDGLILKRLRSFELVGDDEFDE